VDASAAVGAALGEGMDDLGSAPVVPTLLWSEAASALRQMHYRGDIALDELQLAAGRLRDWAARTYASRDLLDDAVAVAIELGWAKTYDAEYIVLARRLGAPLVTLDARLLATATRIVEVRAPRQM